MKTVTAPIYYPGREPRVPLTCACCGESAGTFEQYWNQDLGWGICAKCVRWIASRNRPEDDIVWTYGQPGINYAHPEVTT
jgi:hypothetical protein